MTASRSMVKLYECGHREIAGILTEHAINQAVPLHCTGPCRQCIADGAEPVTLSWRGDDLEVDQHGDLFPKSLDWDKLVRDMLTRDS